MIKDILRLKYQDGLSHERIATVLSISVGDGPNMLSFGRFENAEVQKSTVA